MQEQDALHDVPRAGGALGCPRIAYLGPQGTYGHQAAAELSKLISSGAQAELIPCPTIPDIYTHPAEYLVMPLQNTLHGGVLETLDSLLSPLKAGPSSRKSRQNGDSGGVRNQPVIIGDTDLGIRHCLVARKGVKMKDIRWVRSHEQALGQSTAFLSRHLPEAKRQPWPSTAGAALSLLEDNEDMTGAGAAICSKAAISGNDALQVLYEGTQGIDNNFTRFLLLSRHPKDDLQPQLLPHDSASPIPSHFYALGDPARIADLPRGEILSIHSRPRPPSISTGAGGANGRVSDDDHLDDDTSLQKSGLYPSWTFVETRLSNAGNVGGAVLEKEGVLYLGSTAPSSLKQS